MPVPRWLLPAGWAALLLLVTIPLFGTNASIGLWLMQVLPLLFVLPGLLRGRTSALQWLCFVVLFHFTWAVLQVFSPEPLRRTLGWLGLLFCTLLFTAAIVTLRRKNQGARPGE